MFNKKMTALMVMVAILVAGAAFAGSMEYDVYGKLHTSLNYLNNSDDGQISMSDNSSRFGLKGSKELDNGMSFIWQFENRLNLANGTGTLTSRNSFLGLSDEWGTVLYGRHDTPFKIIGRKATFFGDSIGDFRNMTMGWDRRLTDVVAYISPDFDGFSFLGAFMLDQAAMGAEEGQTAFSGAAMYTVDEAFLAVGFETLSKGFFPMANNTYGEAPAAIRVTGKYDFGQFALAALFQNISNVGGVDGVSATTMGAEGKFTINETYCAKAGFWMGDPNTDADDDEYNQLALGIDKKCGAKTTWYLQYAMIMNGDNAQMGIGSASGHWGDSVAASAAGESPMGISTGFITKF